MIPSQFDYHAPATLEEAIGLLEQYPDEAKVLSGGMSLLPILKLRLGYATQLVDLGRIPDLAYVREENGHIEIGGATREVDVERSELLAATLPILIDTTKVIADPLVRNRATVGGNLAHGDPANDQPAAMLAVRADVVATGPEGERTIPIDDFFVGPFLTALEPTEILTRIRIPVPPAGSGGAYLKLERKVGDYATAATAAQVALGDDGAVVAAGLALTNAGAVPVRAAEAEAYLIGKPLAGEVVAEAARLASTAAEPAPDWRGSVEYKVEMFRVLMSRAIDRAHQRARAAGAPSSA
jgi:carbon-monoxide dehydrogenase medium subunit